MWKGYFCSFCFPLYSCKKSKPLLMQWKENLWNSLFLTQTMVFFLIIFHSEKLEWIKGLIQYVHLICIGHCIPFILFDCWVIKKHLMLLLCFSYFLFFLYFVCDWNEISDENDWLIDFILVDEIKSNQLNCTCC